METKPIVIDAGSASCKAGFGGEETPRAVIPSTIGRPRDKTVLLLDQADRQDCFVGNDAQSRREILLLGYPIKNRIVTNWDDMISLLDHTFKNELCVPPKDHPVLLTETPSNPKAHREKMTEIMLERFNVPSYYVYNQAVLSLYSYGSKTGVVIDSGEGGTHVVPIYEGWALPYAKHCLGLGGRHLTDFLGKLLAERGQSFSTSIVQNIKEQMCCVASNLEKNMINLGSEIEATYTLPDGQMINVGNNRFLCPEAFFEPSLIKMKSAGLHKVCYDAIMKNDVDIQRDLSANIILSGGSTLFPGMEKRMKSELEALIPRRMMIKVVAPKNRENSVWNGGSVVSSLFDFQQMWILKKEYEESGSSIVHRKCF